MGKNEHQPNTIKGKELLAHELTHTIQQQEKEKVISKKEIDGTESSLGQSSNFQEAYFSDIIFPEKMNAAFLSNFGISGYSETIEPKGGLYYKRKPVISSVKYRKHTVYFYGYVAKSNRNLSGDIGVYYVESIQFIKGETTVVAEYNNTGYGSKYKGPITINGWPTDSLFVKVPR